MARRTLALLLSALPFCHGATGDLASGAAAGAGAAATGPIRGDLAVADPQANTTQLFVQNKAGTDVLLVNCAENHSLPAGGNLSITLSGETGFWVVPAGLPWDCHLSPFDFDLFFVAVNFTGSELVASIGRGLPEEVIDRRPTGEPETASLGENQSGTGDDTEAQEGQRLIESLAGVELSAGARSVRCRATSCEASPEATAASAAATELLSLTIMPPRASPLSFWCRRGFGGWGRPRWGPRRGGWGRGWGCRGRWC